MSHDETLALVMTALDTNPGEARLSLHKVLISAGRSEPEFYAGVIEHGPFMQLTSSEWYEFFKRLPVKVFTENRELMNKLSPTQRSAIGCDF